MELTQAAPSFMGRCLACSAHVAKAQMTRHLQSCPQRVRGAELLPGKTTRQAHYLHVVAEGAGLPEYWLHLDVRASTRLSSLDDFLRAVWLECCGHLSRFTVGGVEYVSFDPRDDPFEGEEDLRQMTARVDTALQPKMTFTYEYDFGTTTYLKLHVVSERVGIYRRDPVVILARNDPPDRPCAVCGKPATHVCTMCIYTDAPAWYCDAACQRQHGCVDAAGDTYWLPVTNSPRVGQCAYTGRVSWTGGEE